jgi:oligopeptide transport system ATP-binding protein
MLSVKQLNVFFKPTRPDGKEVHAVRNLDFDVSEGECLAIVGESGCGKSATLGSLLGLYNDLSRNTGELIFKGESINGLSESAMRAIRGKEIAMIFQDPMSALNPTMKIAEQVAEALVDYKSLSKQQKLDEVIRLLKETGLSDPEVRAKQYPFELSGGMLQRVAIAIALAGKPSLLMADEPTTALDVSIQKQVLNLIKQLQKTNNLALLLVTHDLGVVAEMADKVMVMYGGEVLEYGPVKKIINEPAHPYTQALLASLPDFSKEASASKLSTIEGQPPDLSQVIKGCAFVDRCDSAMNICANRKPELLVKDEQQSRCWLNKKPEALS